VSTLKPECFQERRFSMMSGVILSSASKRWKILRCQTRLPRAGLQKGLLGELRQGEKPTVRCERAFADDGVDVRMPVGEFAKGLDPPAKRQAGAGDHAGHDIVASGNAPIDHVKRGKHRARSAKRTNCFSS
jgi:hypothetical protein